MLDADNTARFAHGAILLQGIADHAANVHDAKCVAHELAEWYIGLMIFLRDYVNVIDDDDVHTLMEILRLEAELGS